MAFHATIQGEAVSKANSRRLVLMGGKPRFIKSKKALDYAKSFDLQCRANDPPYDCDVVFGAKIWYASKRPDLDESLILDSLQGYAYDNDRQVKAKLVFWGLDRDNPRAEIMVVPLDQTQEVFQYFNSKE